MFSFSLQKCAEYRASAIPTFARTEPPDTQVSLSNSQKRGKIEKFPPNAPQTARQRQSRKVLERKRRRKLVNCRRTCRSSMRLLGAKVKKKYKRLIKENLKNNKFVCQVESVFIVKQKYLYTYV